jgi:Caspase domain
MRIFCGAGATDWPEYVSPLIMKTWKTLTLAVIVTLMTGVATYLTMTSPDTRSVSLVSPMTPQVAERLKSTGLFVGVSEFAHDPTLTVPFAVDDAIDLAYKFSLDQRSSLVPPRQVVLALSGDPQKEDSKRRLQELADAGIEIEKATSGDILQLLRKQVARSGNNGLLVLSIATHGFLDDNGDAYILGSTSEIGSTETSLPTAKLLDIAGKVTRSLVFIDACRNRAGASTRSGAPDRRTVAPLLERMKRIHGQVVFYAAAADQYAYDDHVSQNGVFTKAVLDGLDCQAATPRGFVNAGTLNTHVEHTVRKWIKTNKDIDAFPATQFSKEGSAHNMALAECWRDPKFPIRAEVDGRRVTAYDESSRQLWRKVLPADVVAAQATDLDADAYYEVVAATADGITVFNRDGDVLWSEDGDGMRLATFTTGDLFERHTNQIVALWHDADTSKLTVFNSDGDELSHYEHAGHFLNVAVGRWTNMHDPRIAVTSATSLFLFHPKKLVPLWERRLASATDTIQDLAILDDANAKYRSIVTLTRRGKTLFGFDGSIVRNAANWLEVPKKKKKGAK